MEIVVRADEGNLVRYRPEDGTAPIRGADIMLPRLFVALFPDDRGGPDLHLRIEVRDGVPQCREVFLQSRDDGREVRQADVRSVDISRYLEIACQLVALHVTEELANGGVMATPSHRQPDLAAVATSVARSRRGGRRQIPEGQLAEVAKVYKANPRRPTKAVEEAFGIAPRTASLYVRRARDAGLLDEDGSHRG